MSSSTSYISRENSAKINLHNAVTVGDGTAGAATTDDSNIKTITNVDDSFLDHNSTLCDNAMNFGSPASKKRSRNNEQTKSLLAQTENTSGSSSERIS